MKYAYYGALALLIALLILFNVLIRKRQASAQKIQAIPHIGSVQVLNGCGGKGAGTEVEAFLRRQGFDVKETGNAPDWNYQETLVVSRVGDMSVAAQVAEALHTGNLLKLRDERSLFDVTVFVGRNFPALIAPVD